MIKVNGFLLGGLVGFATSFISKVRELLRTFRSLFIQRAIVEFNQNAILHYLIKTKKIILFNRLIDRPFYFVRNPVLNDNRTYVVTPVIHNYHGIAYINSSQNESILRNLSNIFYLIKNDERAIEIYYFRPMKIIDKIFELLTKEKFNDYFSNSYYPWNFTIHYIKDDISVGLKDEGRESFGTSLNSKGESSDKDLFLPLYLYENPVHKRHYVDIYKSNFDVFEYFRETKTPREYVEKAFPLFYFSKDFEMLLREGVIWKLCNQSDYGRRKVGILLYGLPGTGKSIMITVLSVMINVPIFVVDLLNSNQSTVVTEISRLAKQEAIILFEDLDVYFDYWNQNKNINSSLFSKDVIKPSTLLNVIDGVDKHSRCMFIFTTNYPEKIDKRMVDINTDGTVVITRPGRIDKAIKVSYAEKEGVEYICNKFVKLYQSILEGENINIQLNKNELVNLVLSKFNELGGRLTYAQVINICFDYLTKTLEYQYSKYQPFKS